jgi:hypothetical protein
MKKNLKFKDELPSAGKMKESGINTDVIDSKRLLDDISCLVENSRRSVAQSVNSELVMLYWQIGKRICEDLPTENRAEYGAKVVELVSESLTAEYGKGFSPQQCVSHDPFRRGFRRCQDSPDTVWTVVVVPFR